MSNTAHQSSSETAKSQNDARDEATRQTILRETLKLLQEVGYSRVTTDMIASRARVSKATIYKFWASKQELEIESTRLRFPKLEVPDLGSFQEEVRYVLEARMTHYRQSGMPRLVAGLVGAASTDEVLQEAFDLWVEQFNATIRLLIERGIGRGDVRPDVDVGALENLVAGVVARCVITMRALDQRTIEQMTALIGMATSPTLALLEHE